MTPHEGPSERLPDPALGCEPSRPALRDRSHRPGLAPGMDGPIYSFLVARGCRRVERLEDSPSGLWRTLGKRVGCKPSGVRIPHPPPPLSPGIATIPGDRFFRGQHVRSTSRRHEGDRQHIQKRRLTTQERVVRRLFCTCLHQRSGCLMESIREWITWCVRSDAAVCARRSSRSPSICSSARRSRDSLASASAILAISAASMR